MFIRAKTSAKNALMKWLKTTNSFQREKGVSVKEMVDILQKELGINFPSSFVLVQYNVQVLIIAAT